jgi:hypothetical protein
MQQGIMLSLMVKHGPVGFSRSAATGARPRAIILFSLVLVVAVRHSEADRLCCNALAALATITGASFQFCNSMFKPRRSNHAHESNDSDPRRLMEDICRRAAIPHVLSRFGVSACNAPFGWPQRRSVARETQAGLVVPECNVDGEYVSAQNPGTAREGGSL